MSGWPNTRLDDCCEIISGATPSTSERAYWNGDICWATPKDLSELEGGYISDTPRKLTTAGLTNCAATVLPAESVLFSSRAPIGHVAINTVPMATNQGFKSFIPRADRVHARFLYHWLRSNRRYLESLGNGATFKEVSKAVVARVEIPLPPLAEQRGIAEILDKADGLRAKRRAALAQLDTLTQSIFLDMFSAPGSHGWPVLTIGEVAVPGTGSIRTGPFGSQLLHAEFTDSGIPVLGIDNVVANEFRWGGERHISRSKYEALRRYTVRPGDVLITIMGTNGRCAVVPEAEAFSLAISTKHLCCISVDWSVCVPGFLHAYFLRHPMARRYLHQSAKGAIMAGLNMSLIKAMPVPVPPLSLQQEFQRQAAGVERLKGSMRASLSELDALFASLQHRAFRGEL